MVGFSSKLCLITGSWSYLKMKYGSIRSTVINSLKWMKMDSFHGNKPWKISTVNTKIWRSQRSPILISQLQIGGVLHIRLLFRLGLLQLLRARSRVRGRPQLTPQRLSPRKKGVKTNHSSRLTKGVPPPKKKRNKSQQLRVTAVLEALVCIFLALNWVFSCSSWHWNHWNHWKTAGKPLEITGVELSIYWDAQSYFGGGSWATQVSEIPL